MASLSTVIFQIFCIKYQKTFILKKKSARKEFGRTKFFYAVFVFILTNTAFKIETTVNTAVKTRVIIGNA